jgi:hypothetical protein
VPRFLESGAMQGQVEVGSDVDPLEQEADEFAQAAGHYAPVVPRFLARACASPLYRGADGQKVPALEKPGLSPEAGPVGRLRLRGDPPNDGCDADNHCDRTTVRSSVTREDTAEPLAASVRARLEDSLGLDLGSVQIHRGPATSRAAAELHAKAFAHGRDIWLGAGQRSDDFGLMAHEVAHVVQQSDQQGPIRRRGNADASPETGAGDEADPSRQTFGFSEDEMESRLAGTPAEGADTSAPTVEPGASTESTLSEVEGEGGEEGAGEPATADERGQAQAEAEGGERGEGRAGRGARRSGSGDGQGRPSAPEVPGPASAFENLVGADVAAYLDGNLSDERLAALDPQTQALLEAANLLGDRSITDPEASVLQGLAGEGLQPGVSTTGYEGEPGWLRTLARVRDITGQLGGIVGIIGLACMVAGFILSLLVWPVGAFLLTVGRFCDIAAVILDGISLALGLILTRYNYYRLKNETNPEERRRLLGMVRQNAMGTVMSGIAVATAVAPGAGRLLGRAGRRVSRGIRTVSRRGGTLGRGARALRLAGVARRSAMRAGRRRIAAAGSSVASGFRRLSQSSSLPGRAARSVSTAYGVGARALGATRSAVGGWGMRQLGRARGTMPVRWANRVGGRAEDWMRRSGRNLATRNTVMGRFYNRRLRGFHERNVMLARSINDPVRPIQGGRRSNWTTGCVRTSVVSATEMRRSAPRKPGINSSFAKTRRFCIRFVKPNSLRSS